MLKDNETENRRDNRRSYVVFLAAIAAVPAMATDMYLAAMPVIAGEWGVPDSRVALSLGLWFVGFSVFLLILGPLDRPHSRLRPAGGASTGRGPGDLALTPADAQNASRA